MSAHLSSRQIEQYRGHSVSPAELLRMDDHLSTCDRCRTQVADPEQVEAAFSSLRGELKSMARMPQEHLTYEQIAAYVDDQLNVVEREIVDSHTSVCGRCKEELRELFAFKETMLPAIAGDSLRAPGFLERVGAWWAAAVPARLLTIRMIGAFGLALLSLALIVVWLGRRSDREPQVANVQPTSSPVVIQSPLPTASTSGQNNQNVQAGNENINRRQAPEPLLSQPNTAPPVATPSPQLALNDGGQRVILNDRGDLEGLAELPQTEREAIRSALNRQRLETPAALAEVAGKRSALLGNEPEGETFSLVGPAGVILESERPTFRWSALEGATSYTVKIYDTNFKLITTSGSLNSTGWTPRQPLERGKVYRWQVVAVKDGREVLAPAPPAPEARFKVLGDEQAAELARSLRASRNSHLARGIIYTRAGLLEDAEREFTALVRENPKSTVSRKLLNNVRMMRRAR